ncbi:hypothetical protein DPMN_041261 [Dreissena polymorpha]|uniref:Uncharacterized protein n=1 Tax=Dreissena polymorpha TaxID=45954 RepID=A0A9D4HVV2_DREPO|nr:hypothetical protein DPMN_041261 [Dreissena polymorpha]
MEKVTNIIGTNLLTKFHEDRKINVASRVLTRFYYSHIWKNASPPGSHVFQPTGIIFELIQDIIGMNLLRKFHEDWTVNVASTTNLLTKFYEDWKINVASREKCPAPGGDVFKATKTIFKLIQDIIGTNLLTKFHDDRKINVTSRPHPCGGHVFQPTGIIFELVQDIIKMNLLTEFHEVRTKNVASRVKKCPAPWRPCHSSKHIIKANLLTKFHQEMWHLEKNAPPLAAMKNAPPLGSMFFKQSGTNLLSKFHEDRKINVASKVLTRKNSPPPRGHVFQPTSIIFELVQDIIGMNLLTKKNAPPIGNHVFQANVTIFELIQDIIETDPLTTYHEDWTINVANYFDITI